jgi:hypothetical protein
MTTELIRETPGGDAAFWATYFSLRDNGVDLAQIRATIAEQITLELIERQAAYGLGHILAMAQGAAVVEAVASQIRPHTLGAVSSRVVEGRD